MKQRILLFVAIVFLTSGTASPALAQYVYLDVNGDGLNYYREVHAGNLNAVPDVITPSVYRR